MGYNRVLRECENHNGIDNSGDGIYGCDSKIKQFYKKKSSKKSRRKSKENFKKYLTEQEDYDIIDI